MRRDLAPLFLALLSSLLIASCEGGKIMFWMPAGSKSMKITYMPMLEELAKRGHEITLVHPFKMKESVKGITEIISSDKVDKFLNDISKQLITSEEPPPLPFSELMELGMEGNRNVLNDPRMKKMLSDPNTKFDVVMTVFFSAHEAGYYLAHRFQAQLVLYCTGQVSIPMINHAMGMPHNPALLPLGLFDYEAYKMTFWQRTLNTMATNLIEVARNYYLVPKVEAILDDMLPGVERPSLLDLEKGASLTLHYGHQFIADGNRPLAPNHIYIGMMNCREPKPLPEDLKNFMDSGKDGVIYVSFGSVLQASEMPESKRMILLNTFKKLKQKVIWKWETEQMEGLPSNVKLSKWLPQQDILAHPNTKVFITHAGQSSTQETLCHKVPVIAVPVSGDQPANADYLKRSGVGETIQFQRLSEDKLYDALQKVLNDPSYKAKVTDLGSLLVDQIDKPLDRAVWWIEHLIRHPSLASHMRSPVHNLTWYQYYLLDVLALILSVILTVLFIFYKILKCICCRSGGQDRDLSKKRQ